MTRYYTNFEDSDIGSLPTGWTARLAAASRATPVTAAYGTPIVKRRIANYIASAVFPGLVSWDALDADADRDDVEVLGAAERGADAAQEAILYARASGALGSDDAYMAVLRWSDSSSPNRADIVKRVGGTTTVVAGVSYTPDTSKTYLMRFRVEGTALKLRVWAEDEDEPSAWTVETTDSDVSGAGWVGFQGYGATQSLNIPGTMSGAAPVSTPDSAAASVTGDLDLRIDLALDNIAAATQVLMAKAGSAGQYGYFFQLIAGVPRFVSSADGTALLTANATANISTVTSNGSRIGLRATIDVNNGAAGRTVRFYTSSDFQTWTQLGADVTSAGVTSIFDNTGALEIGSQIGGTLPVAGKVYRAQVYNGIAGTLVVDFNAADAGSLDSTFTSNETGETWTVGSPATIAGEKAIEFNYLSVGTGGDTAWKPRTNDEFTAWLDTMAERRILAEMSAVGYDSVGAASSPPTYTKTVNAYIANGGYTSQAWDDPPSKNYRPWMIRAPSFRREMGIALSGRAGVGFGEMVVSNPRDESGAGGVRDDWTRMKWKKDFIEIYLGADGWAKHDFRKMIVARNDGATAPSPEEIAFKLLELSDNFDEPLQTDLVGGSTANANKPKPDVFGGVYIVAPVQYDDVNLKYYVHSGDMRVATDRGVVNVYDDFVSLTSDTLTVSSVDTGTDTITMASAHGWVAGSRTIFVNGTPPAPLVAGTSYFVLNPSGATFQLAATPGGAVINLTSTGSGTITAKNKQWQIDEDTGILTLLANPSGLILAVSANVSAVEGSAGTYDFSLAKFVREIATDRAGLSENNIDDSAFDALTDPDGSAGTQWMVGFATNSQEMTCRQAIEKLLEAHSAWYGFTPDGLMQIGQLDLPESDAVMTFTESDIAAGSLVMTTRLLPWKRSSVRFGYQPSLTDPEAALRVLYEAQTPYHVTPALADSAATVPVDTAQQGDTVPYTFKSLAIAATSAIPNTREPTRLADFRSKMLGVFRVQVPLRALELNIGETIAIEHSRLGWKTWSASDPSSPDNTSDIDSTKAVVIGIETALGEPGPFPVTLTVFRQIPGYYPEADLT